MKKLLTLLAISFLTFGLSAQQGYVYHYSDHHGSGYGNNGHYHDSGYYNYGNYYNGSNYRNRNNRLDRLSRRDRKRIKKLERKLAEQKRCAWEDGYLSRRDRKRIRQIQRDIDNIWLKYERRNRGSRINYTGRTCP